MTHRWFSQLPGPCRRKAYDWSMMLTSFEGNRPRLAVLILAIVLPRMTVMAQPVLQSPAAAMATAVRTLADEARLIKNDKQLPRRDANFAQEFGQSLPPELVGSRLVRRVDRDPFVDAYVRWQLTSFDPALRPMADRAFQRFLRDLPPMVESPRAREALIGEINAAIRSGQLSQSEQLALGRRLDGLAKQTREARTMNRPTGSFYDWVASQLPPTGARVLQLELARLNALVNAGWPTDTAKSQLEELFNASARDESFDADQRRLVAEMTQRLVGRTRVYLTSARIDEGAVVAQFNDTGVYDFDVQRWTKAILRN